MILSAGESSIMPKTVIPAGYRPALGLYDTQKAIGLIKQIFLEKLCGALHLKRVTAPLFVDPATGLNDDLNGVERPVTFDVPALGANAEVVHSLAKWKRMALAQYDFHVGNGLVTDMNAIRRDEEMDNLHSIYVDLSLIHIWVVLFVPVPIMLLLLFLGMPALVAVIGDMWASSIYHSSFFSLCSQRIPWT